MAQHLAHQTQRPVLPIPGLPNVLQSTCEPILQSAHPQFQLGHPSVIFAGECKCWSRSGRGFGLCLGLLGSYRFTLAFSVLDRGLVDSGNSP